MTHNLEDFTVNHDVHATFARAIDQGRLSAEPEHDNFAGKYMYMHTHEGKDCFKNIITRKYIK